jgi:hypothetical protein
MVPFPVMASLSLFGLLVWSAGRYDIETMDTYTPEIALAICQRLAEGESLRTICRADGMPDKATVMRWLHAHPDFREQYAVARDIGTDALAEEALADATAPMTEKQVQAARLQFDARRWYIGKIAPKRWGDKVVTEVSGADGGPVQLAAVPRPMVAKEISEGIKALLAKSEEAVGLPSGEGLDDATRLRTIMSNDQPMHPDLFEALHNG